jgi:hypothetical protein
MADEAGDLLDRHAAAGQERDERALQLPRRPGVGTRYLPDRGAKVTADVGRVGSGRPTSAGGTPWFGLNRSDAGYRSQSWHGRVILEPASLHSSS